jgi:hypothetical protein
MVVFPHNIRVYQISYFLSHIKQTCIIVIRGLPRCRIILIPSDILLIPVGIVCMFKWLCILMQQKQAIRLNNLLTVQKIKDQEGKTKTLNTETIPHNLEARRRLQFFTNSLFMHMPQAPPIRKMFSFWSVFFICWYSC